jgi:Domain of unknown function (DUF4160)
MPTFLRSGPYRLFVYAGGREEPPHVHVEHYDKVAKFWLDPIRLQRSDGFSRRDMARIQNLLRVNQARLLEAWNDYFSG